VHAIIRILEFMNYVISNKVHKVQAKNKVQKVRTSQLWAKRKAEITLNCTCLLQKITDTIRYEGNCGSGGK